MPEMGKGSAYLPRWRRIILVAGLFLTWSLALTALSHDGIPPIRTTTTSSTPEWLPVKKLSCTDTFWDPEKCGIEGENCLPFSNQYVAFQCPVDCVANGIVTGKPHLAGGEDIIGQPLVIGGPIYRGDSYICPAAVHAGVVEPSTGGCGVARFMGMTNSFTGSPGAGNIDSIDVQTYFPLTYRFTVESDAMECPAPAKDMKWTLPFVSAAHTGLVWQTTRSSAVRTLWSMAVMYAHLRLRDGAREWIPSRGSSSTSPASPRDAAGEIPIPHMLEPEIFTGTISNATFKWSTPVPKDVEGISMWLDDVERSRRYFGNGANKVLKEGEQADSFLWQRTPQAFPDYVRFGYIKGGKVVKYSQAGTWFTNGTWTGIPPEPRAQASLD